MAEKRKRKFNDLGLGTKTALEGYRALNKNGTFNVQKTNIPFFERVNIFHSLITMSWPRFFGLLLLGYFVINLVFASIYTAIGVENLTGVDGATGIEGFFEAFFFSAQTITTLGYGRVAPIGILANIVAATESMMGLLGFALATGMLFGRFSKPSSKIKYSTHAVMAPYQNINAFMFRVVNPQDNQLVEVEAKLTLSIKREDSELRSFYLLNLERPNVVFFPYMWTIVHPIDKSSPLYGLNEIQLAEKDPEFIINLKAFDESSSQPVYSRSSYKAFEIKWGEKFVYVLKRNDDGVTVDVGRLDETEKTALNPITWAGTKPLQRNTDKDRT